MLTWLFYFSMNFRKSKKNEKNNFFVIADCRK